MFGTLRVVVLAVVLCGCTVGLCGALVLFGAFCVCLVRHLGSAVVRVFPVGHQARPIVFSMKALARTLRDEKALPWAVFL